MENKDSSAGYRSVMTREALELFVYRKMDRKEAEEFMAKLKGDAFEVLPDGTLKPI